MTNQFFAALQLVLGSLGVLLLALILLGFVLLILRRGQGRAKSNESKLKVTHLNEKYEESREAILQETLSKKEYKALHKQNEKTEKEHAQQEQSSKPKIFVLDFFLNICYNPNINKRTAHTYPLLCRLEVYYK